MRINSEKVASTLRVFSVMFLSFSAAVGGSIFISQNRANEENIRFLSEEELRQVQGIQSQEVVTTKWKVDIAGEVNTPGVIEIEPGLTMLQVIELAGGFTKNADQRYIQKNINLAQEVEDRQKIYIPSIQENSSQAATGNPKGTTSQVSLNSASMEEIEGLPGIGPSTAQKIIDARPFKSVDGLKEVAGVGDATFEKLKPYVTL